MGGGGGQVRKRKQDEGAGTQGKAGRMVRKVISNRVKRTCSVTSVRRCLCPGLVRDLLEAEAASELQTQEKCVCLCR